MTDQTPSAGSRRRSEASFSVASLLSAIVEPQELLGKILDVASSVVGADRAILFTLNSLTGELELAASLGLEEEGVDDALDISRGALREAAAGRRVITLDAQTDESLRQHQSIARFGIRSILCAPLALAGETLGVIYIDSRRGGPLFDAADLEFLEVFAQQAAIALNFSRRVGRLREDAQRLKLELEGPAERFGIIGRSPAIRLLWQTIERFAPPSIPVLISGESGTGKEMVARALHAHSGRHGAPFLAENCAALPETLLESELFGHARGAFTGADRDQRGLFEKAHGGMLLLDEVTEMAPGLQAKLLRVLQEGEVRPLGSEERRRVDVRVVATTNRGVAEALQSGRLREDLFYRLAGMHIEVPPLRERREDIPLLFKCFVERSARARDVEPPRIDPRVWRPLVNYDWPGNVRELQSEAARVSLLCRDPAVLDLQDLERAECVALAPIPAYDDEDAPVVSLSDTERLEILRALRASSGSRDRAARLLGISRATLFRKIRRFHLQA